jgi:hypothetical protein
VSEVASEGMTFDQAAEALTQAGSQEAAESSAASPELGAFATPAEQAEATPTPGEEAAPEEQTPFTSPEVPEDSFTGSDFNPDLLPPELQDGWKSLQGDYTRKTQELAEQRKALEALGSPEELQQAQEFFQSLQDPEYLQAFYGELGGVLDELGLREAAPAADETVAPPALELPPELAQLGQTDPELAPLVDQFQQMRSELDSFRQEQQQREQAMAEERQLMDQAAEIDRMVQAVREDNPNYGDDDWQAIYDRAVAFDGDVLKAAELYANDRSRIIEGYLSQKQTPHQVTAPSGGNVVTEDEPTELTTLEQAQEAAEAYLEANDLSEFGG